MHICSVHLCIDPVTVDERLRPARPGEPALLRARRDAERHRRAARRHPAAGRRGSSSAPGPRASSRSGSSTGPPSSSPAADALRRSYGLDAVHLAPTVAGPEDLTRRMVGRLAAEVLRGAVRDGAIVGIGDGASVSAHGRRPRGGGHARSRATVVPLCGGYWSTGPEREPYRRVADALGGQAARPDGARARRRRRHASGRSSRTRASGPSSTCGSGSTSRSSGSAARPGARVGGRRRVERELETVRRRRRGPRRPVRPRRAVRLPGPARAGHRLRCAPARARPGRDRRRGGREQGPADPRRAAGRRRPDARHRRRDRGGRRRARPSRAGRHAEATPMSATRTRRSSASTSARPRSRPGS